MSDSPERDDQVSDDALADEVTETVSEDQPVSENVESELEELVKFLLGHLMDEPELVEVSLDRRGNAVHVQLQMPEAELGKVIGRGGRIAKAIRTVLLVAGSRHNVRVSLDIEG